MLNVGAWVGISSVKLYTQYLQRKNENPILTPLDIQNLLVAPAASRGDRDDAGQPADPDVRHGHDARPRGTYDTKAYHLGASWQFMPKNTLYGVYNYGKDTARSAWATQDASASHYGVAYQYQFSPRSSLYATVAFLANSDQGRMSPNSAGYTAGFATEFGADTAAYQLGMRHAF